MRRLLTTALVITLLTAGTGATAVAGDGEAQGYPPEAVQQELIDRFSEPVVFYVEFYRALARKTWFSTDIVSAPDASVDLGPGCIADGVEEYGNAATVVATGGTTDEQLIFTLPVKNGAIIFDVVFKERCFSDTSQQIYDRFEATLVNNRGIANLINRLP